MEICNGVNIMGLTVQDKEKSGEMKDGCAVTERSAGLRVDTPLSPCLSPMPSHARPLLGAPAHANRFERSTIVDRCAAARVRQLLPSRACTSRRLVRLAETGWLLSPT